MLFSPHGGIIANSEAPKEEPQTDPSDYSAILARYRVPNGKILIARDRVPNSWKTVVGDDGVERTIYATEDRVDLMQQFEPWGTVLMVGDPYKTDYGTTIRPPNVKEGQRVLVAPTGGKDVDLTAGGMTMTVTLVGFAGILLIDDGEAAQ